MSDKDFYSGIRTALKLLMIHGEETLYRELIDTMRGTLCSFFLDCIEEDDTHWAGLEKYNILRKVYDAHFNHWHWAWFDESVDAWRKMEEHPDYGHMIEDFEESGGLFTGFVVVDS